MSPLIRDALLRSQSDARLARMVADGHAKAFDVIVERYRRALRRYCQRMLSESLAEDVVQQTFMRAWAALQGGMEIRDLRPWLYRVAHNAAINMLKRAGYHYEQLEHTMPGSQSPEVQVERQAEIRSLLAGVAALPYRQREALLRTALDGESRSDVARDLGMTDGSVGQLLHRARMTLRAAASALTPLPILGWASGKHSDAGPAARVMELMTGGGGAGVAGMAIKGGAVIAAAGAVAGVPLAIHHIAPGPTTPATRMTASVEQPGAGSTRVASGQGLALGASILVRAGDPLAWGGTTLEAGSQAPAPASAGTQSGLTADLTGRASGGAGPDQTGSTPAAGGGDSGQGSGSGSGGDGGGASKKGTVTAVVSASDASSGSADSVTWSDNAGLTSADTTSAEQDTSADQGSTDTGTGGGDSSSSDSSSASTDGSSTSTAADPSSAGRGAGDPNATDSGSASTGPGPDPSAGPTSDPTPATP